MSNRPIYAFGDFQLDPSSRRLTRAGTPVAVSPKAFDVLSHLLQHSGKVVTKEALLTSIWPDSFVEESNLSQQVFALRRALQDCSGYIVTLPGKGYQFGERVSVLDPEAQIAALPPSSDTRAAARRTRWPYLAAAAIVLLLATGAWLYHRSHLQRATGFRRLLVTDFRNSTGNATLDETLRRALEIELSQSPYLDLMADGEAVAILKQMGRKVDTPLLDDVAQEVCERGNRQILLSGSVAHVGSKFVLALQAASCVNGGILAGDKVEVAREDDLLSALDAVANHVRRQLGESTQSIRSFDVPIEQATTPSLEALKFYSIAGNMLAHGAESASVLPFYQRAVQIDPHFAMGFEALANIYYVLDEPGLAAESARKAFNLAQNVGEREKLAIQTHFHAQTERDLLAAISTAQLWAAIYPRDSAPWMLVAEWYTDIGQYPSAIQAGQQAVALAPDQAVAYSVLARAERRANHFAEARRIAQLGLSRHLDSPGLHGTLYQTALAENDTAAVEKETAWGTKDGGWFFLTLQAEVAAQAGKVAEMHRLYLAACSKAEASHLPETIDVIRLEEANLLLMLGSEDRGRQALDSVSRKNASSNADLAIALAHIGDLSAAQAYLAAPPTQHSGTLEIYRDVPRVRAALALARHNPGDAVAAFEHSGPFELVDLDIPGTLAEALRLSGQSSHAEQEYRKVLENIGVDPTSVAIPLAHLGLARLYAAQGKLKDSHQEYEALFTTWKDADSDFKSLRQARLEFQAIAQHGHE